LTRGILVVMAARWLWAAVAAAAMVWAQAPEERADISGAIVDQQTGRPLKGAEACLAEPGAERRCALTEGDGRFEFRVGAGRYILSASRAGYLSANYGARPGSRYTVVAVEAGMRVGNLEVRLQRFPVVSGRVVNEDQEPVQDAEVAVWSLPRRRNRDLPLRRAASSATNDLGEYRVPGLAPGNYYVSVTPRLPDLPCAAAFPRQVYGMTFYPGATDATQAVPVRLEAGLDLNGIDFTVLPARAWKVRGKVGMDFEGVASPTIGLGRPGLAAPARPVPVNPADGSFAFCGVLPGQYVLEGSWREGGTVLHAREEIEVGDAPMGELLVRPAKAAEIAGRVKVEGAGTADLSGVNVALPGEEGLGGIAALKADRTFVFQGVWAGGYRPDLWSLPACCYLKSARLRGQDVLRDGFQVEAGESLSGLELVVATDAAAVAGVALDREEKPVAGALVTIVPDLESAHPGSTGTSADTDQTGGFLLQGIAPGDYRVYAWEDPGDIEWFRPEAVEAYRGRSTAVRVPEGLGEAVTVHLIPK
jgi:hypothetical protein